MKNLWAGLWILLLSAGASSQAPITQPQPATLPLTGRVSGLVTAATSENVTLAGMVNNRPATRSYTVASTLRVDLVPPANAGLSKVTVSYGQVSAGSFGAATWILADRKSIVRMAAELDVVEGRATAMALFAACTSERCEIPNCKQKCNATKCACPD